MLACEMASVAARVAPAPRVELEPHEEHEEHDTDLRDHDRNGATVGGAAAPPRRPPSSEGAEQDAGNHLADHRRLVQVGKHPAQQLTRHNDRCEGHKDPQQDGTRLDRRGGARRFGSGRCRQRFAITANEKKGDDGDENHQAVTDHSREKRPGTRLRVLIIVVHAKLTPKPTSRTHIDLSLNSAGNQVADRHHRCR